MSSTIGSRDDGIAIAIGLVPSTAFGAAGRRHHRSARRGVDGDETGLRNHLDIIGAAPAHPGIGHRHQRNAVRGGFPDRRLRRIIQRQHADIVAAVEGDRDVGLAQHLHGPARLLEMRGIRNVEDLGEARIFISAQSGIDDVIGDDARLAGVIADAAQRALARSRASVTLNLTRAGVMTVLFSPGVPPAYT